ncbi:hypothetical protein B0H14DRAFT_3177688 [Mycena olivaceomarginata]|nr:hypothetical protein B0H14DRAFT_3177688 [Mycena olivaceomarginata]
MFSLLHRMVVLHSNKLRSTCQLQLFLGRLRGSEILNSITDWILIVVISDCFTLVFLKIKETDIDEVGKTVWIKHVKNGNWGFNSSEGNEGNNREADLELENTAEGIHGRTLSGSGCECVGAWWGDSSSSPPPPALPPPASSSSQRPATSSSVALPLPPRPCTPRPCTPPAPRVRRLQAMRMRRLRQDTSDGQAADAWSVNTDALAGGGAQSPSSQFRWAERGRVDRGRRWDVPTASSNTGAEGGPAHHASASSAGRWTCATRMSRATRVRRRLLGGRGGKGGSVGSSGGSTAELLRRRCSDGGKGQSRRNKDGVDDVERAGRGGIRKTILKNWENEGIQMKMRRGKNGAEELTLNPLQRPSLTSPALLLLVPVPVLKWLSSRPHATRASAPANTTAVLDTDPSLWPGDSGRFPLLKGGGAETRAVGAWIGGRKSAASGGARTAAPPPLYALGGLPGGRTSSCSWSSPKRTPLEDEVDVDAAVEDAADDGRAVDG